MPPSNGWSSGWTTLRRRLHLYFSLHQRAHGRDGSRSDAHDAYVACAKGDDLDAMRSEIERHLRRGVEALEAFVARRGVGGDRAVE